MSSQEIIDNVQSHRYELLVDGEAAGFAEYRLRPPHGTGAPRVVFTHTEVDPAYGGRGLGGALAKGALDDVRAKGAVAVPLCPFIKRYIERHPEYQDLVAP